ncbi:MAG: hypothetical protein LBD72_01690, partial [Puniceicoccales bacterium]|nr:hypothetical protein [Puniceicoccales bacterium]
LIPNGLNEDGTFADINVALTSAATITQSLGASAFGIVFLIPDDGAWAYPQCGVKTQTSFWLRARLNTTIYTEKCDWVAIGIGL